VRLSELGALAMNRVLASALTGVGLAAVVNLGVAWSAERLPPGVPQAAELLLRYDANHDGVVTRAEMEAGLKADYQAADLNHDGCLDPHEVQVENDRRLAQDGAAATPLKDWNLDGCVDIHEFSNVAHSYFDLADRRKDGRVTVAELRGPTMPIAPPEIPKKAKPAEQPAQPSAAY
jgi:EF hand